MSNPNKKLEQRYSSSESQFQFQIPVLIPVFNTSSSGASKHKQEMNKKEIGKR